MRSWESAAARRLAGRDSHGRTDHPKISLMLKGKRPVSVSRPKYLIGEALDLPFICTLPILFVVTSVKVVEIRVGFGVAIGHAALGGI